MVETAVRIPHRNDSDIQAVRHQDAETLVQLAKLEPLTDGGIRTFHILARALSKAPQHHEAQILREHLNQTFVPRWHFPMLADKIRNQAYAKAINAKIRLNDVVLDIGCGAGLTAMLAARAGAKHVYTCEQQPLIAQAAAQVIADNGLSDRITVIPKLSHDLIVGRDIPEQVDVVISEIVDTVLLGEGVLATLTHAMSVLAKPQARTIPERGVLMAQPVESDKLLEQWRPQEAEGFDLSAFHRFANVAQITPNDFAAFGLKGLGPKTPLFQFDFGKPNVASACITKSVGCAERGTAHAVLVSFEMELAPGIVLTNDLSSDGHWGRTAFLLDHPISVDEGDSLRITAQHDASRLSVSVHDTIPSTREAEQVKAWMHRAIPSPQQVSGRQRPNKHPDWSGPSEKSGPV